MDLRIIKVPLNSVTHIKLASSHMEFSRPVFLPGPDRRICRDLSSPWMLSLQQVCSRASCNEMKGGEWLYLCAAHPSANETECCAVSVVFQSLELETSYEVRNVANKAQQIDYINHTLDAASALLCSKRYFPSRFRSHLRGLSFRLKPLTRCSRQRIGVPDTSVKHFTSIARRMYRIFSHAFYHVRQQRSSECISLR